MPTVSARPARATDNSLVGPRDTTARPASPVSPGLAELLVYVALGACFGVLLIKSEAASWYRIQEMLRFRSGHLFGVLGSAALTAGIGLRLLRRDGARALTGAAITLPPKQWGTGARYMVGGTLFGVGWTLTGACPGPFYALIGAGVAPMLIPLTFAILGAWVYGWMRPLLPH